MKLRILLASLFISCSAYSQSQTLIENTDNQSSVSHSAPDKGIIE